MSTPIELFSSNQANTTVLAGGTANPPPQSGAQEIWTVLSSTAFGAAATNVSQFHVADADISYSGEIIAVTSVNGSGAPATMTAQAA